jgi:hypothetical protein
MKLCLSTALEILYKTEAAQIEGSRQSSELMPHRSSVTNGQILVKKGHGLGREQLDGLLEEIGKIVDLHKAGLSITDWPFEHFWGNPYEPYHSNLLRYFLNPREEHGCGKFLLRKLFEVLTELKCLPADYHFPVDRCEVQAEFGRIDLLITGHGKDGRYAIIIENKINAAVYQPKQLQRYAKIVLEHKFEAKRTHVFYLPLTQERDPEDFTAIRALGIENCKTITFDKHVLKWLREVLKKEYESKLPSGMRENLSHYLNLITYLIHKRKEIKMDEHILEELKKADDALPAWSQVKTLKASATALEQCFEGVLRGKLLLRVQALLKQKESEADVRFYSDDDEPAIDSPYHPRFSEDLTLGLRASDAVIVGFGASPEYWPEIFYTGYKKSGDTDRQQKQEPFVLGEATNHLGLVISAPGWYGWDWNSEITYENCLDEKTVSRVADTLIEMRDSLRNRLNNYEPPPGIVSPEPIA